MLLHRFQQPRKRQRFLDPNLLVFTMFSNENYTLLYPEQWTYEENKTTLSTVFKNKNGHITYTLTPDPVRADLWVIKTESAPFLQDVLHDYPEYIPENIMRDFGHFLGIVPLVIHEVVLNILCTCQMGAILKRFSLQQCTLFTNSGFNVPMTAAKILGGT
jgi:hypothetical protein